MNRKTTNILLLVVFGLILAAAFAFLTDPKTQAQTSSGVRTATPTPKTNATPQPSPTIEEDGGIITVKTELVNLNVRIVDRNNRPIGNVLKGEVKVYEDNVLQQIDSFTKAEVPTNYALVIDNSGSLRHQLDKVIDASKVIVNTNRPGDETSVVRFVSSDKIEVVQDFTPNKTDVNEALDNLFIEGGQTAIIDAVYLAAEKVDSYEKTRNPNEKKRRALILVSDGEDRDSYYNEQQLFELLRESDVQIYAIGFTTDLSKEGGFITKSPKAKSEAFLRRLAEETGGKAYFPQAIGELDTIARDIASELRTQYLISYYPSDESADGRFKNIRVVVDDGPNKQKRIAITRTGRTANTDTPAGAKPTLQTTNQSKPNNR
ncbi:MAG TPA: VWA domain-containing protein [Pyrinomonadaceae bacterium]|nr:VWA domain-containing protein [Pyrinomonadaceae bacterium]